MMTRPGDDDVQPYAGPMVISFTVGQSFVGVNVGLDSVYSFPVSAILRAFDDPDPGEGSKLTPTPDPTVLLGTGPTDITTPLSFSMPGGASSIRRVEIEFLGPVPTFSALEVIDDLTYSEIGPLCVTDTQPPTVQIVQPTGGQTINTPQVLLDLRAQDLGSGIASMELTMLGAGGVVLASGVLCGGPGSSTCRGTPPGAPTDVRMQFFTSLQSGTIGLRLRATDFAGNVGQAQVFFTLALPDSTYNLWALGVELTQGIQDFVPTSTVTRNRWAPQASMVGSTIPLVARKRTVVRLYPGVEGTGVAVVGARATLSCVRTLGGTPDSGEPCAGPLGATAVIPQITVDPASGTDVTALRLNPARSWNFVLPDEWIEPGGPRWLIAHVQAPPGVPECGSNTSGCDDGANFFVLNMPGFQETAPLRIKPIFPCVRRSSGVPRETCDAIASSETDARAAAEWFLWGRDWDGDGVLDPFFNLTLPVADGIDGIEILPPTINDYFDGDLSSPSGIMSGSRMRSYLHHICDELIFDWTEIVTDPGELIAEGYARNLRYLAFVPPPTGPSGRAYADHPCGVAKVSLDPARIGDGVNAPENDFCSNCPDDPRFTIHWDEPSVTHEITHTFEIRHASCDHDEDLGDEVCDPAPSVFPCPDGGICTSATELNQPIGFNTFNMAVLPPRSGAVHAHDYISYGDRPVWVSPHTYTRVYHELRDIFEQSSRATPTGNGVTGGAQPASPASQVAERPIVMVVSGQIEQPGNQVTLGPAYRVPAQSLPTEGEGSHTLELQDATGRVVSRRRFDPTRVVDDEGGRSSQFFQPLRFDPRATRLVLKAGDTVLAQRRRSRDAPDVQVTSPAAGDHWVNGRQRIVWTASDRDGDALVHVVQYSADGGKSWRVLANHVDGGTFDAETDQLAGSEHALVRVLTSDGFNAAITLSAPFRVAAKSPDVRILAPASGAAFSERQPITFVGTAVDAEEGGLDDQAYAWTSSLDGALGVGHRTRPVRLSPGTHVIALSASDRDGRASRATVTVRVDDEPNRQPVADAGPDQDACPEQAIELRGGASSDPDGDSLSFFWQTVSGPSGVALAEILQNPTSPSPRFLARVTGEYVVALVVSDGAVNSFPDRVVITVRTGPGPSTGTVPQKGTVAIGGDVGLFVPADTFETATTIAGFVEFYLSRRVGFRTTLGWTNPELDGSEDLSLRHVRLLFDVFRYWERGRWHPFVGAGAGVYFLQPKVDGQAVGASETQPGWHVGGGFEYFTTRTLSIKGEAGYHVIRDGHLPWDPSGLTLTIGLKRYF